MYRPDIKTVACFSEYPVFNKIHDKYHCVMSFTTAVLGE